MVAISGGDVRSKKFIWHEFLSLGTWPRSGRAVTPGARSIPGRALRDTPGGTQGAPGVPWGLRRPPGNYTQLPQVGNRRLISGGLGGPSPSNLGHPILLGLSPRIPWEIPPGCPGRPPLPWGPECPRPPQEQGMPQGCWPLPQGKPALGLK